MMKIVENLLLFWTMRHQHRIVSLLYRLVLPYVRFSTIGPVMPVGPRLPIYHSGRALPMLERSALSLQQ